MRILPDLHTKTVEFSFYEKSFFGCRSLKTFGSLNIEGSATKHKIYALIDSGGTLLEGSTGNLESHTDFGMSNYGDNVRSNWEIR